MDPSKTAVVLIEYQNDFTTENGVLHDAVKDTMSATDMLANTRSVVDAARAAGVTVVHAPIQFAAGYDEITKHPYGILKGVVDTNAFVKGSWGAEIVDDVKPDEETSSWKASAGWTRSPAPTSTSSCAARASRRSRSAAS